MKRKKMSVIIEFEGDCHRGYQSVHEMIDQKDEIK